MGHFLGRLIDHQDPTLFDSSNSRISSLYNCFRRVMRPRPSSYGSSTSGPVAFTLAKLEEYTGGFEKFIGWGGFGEVFQGAISDMKIAVKVSRRINPRIRTQFQAEVEHLPKVEQQNIIKLVGYCETEEKLYIVYPFMPNGNVQRKLSELDWSRTIKILKGVATAIQKLHDHSPSLIYRDLKPDNIVLHMDFNPELAGFGTVTVEEEYFRYGTHGYTDPIVMDHGQGTKPNDLYSFGVVMLPLIMKEKHVSIGAKECKKHITERARSRDVHYLLRTDCSLAAAKEIKNLAFDCVGEDVDLRPTITQVLHRLSLIDDIERSRRIHPYKYYRMNYKYKTKLLIGEVDGFGTTSAPKVNYLVDG